MNRRNLTTLLLASGAAATLTGCAARGDFKLQSLDGQKISLSEQKGKVVLLAFFAAG